MLSLRPAAGWGKALKALGVGLLALSLAGCSPYPLSPIKPEGLVARQDDNLYEIVSVIAFVVFFIVAGLIVYSAIRFHRPRSARSGDEPRQVFGNTPLELTWTFIPVLIVTLLFALAVQTLRATAVPSRPPAGALTIDVIGHQWYWEYKYRQFPGVDYTQTHDSKGLTDGLHIPVNRTVVLRITGYDVQHGWWVPALAGKNEAIPGHINLQQFVADKVGTYYAVCSYYCGVYHYNMLASVVVQTQADFDTWLAAKRAAAQPTAAPTVAGNRTPQPVAPLSFSKDVSTIFSAHCAACHIQQQLGGLNLGNYQGLLKGGAVVPGSIVKPGDHLHSTLWQIIQPAGPWPGGNRMPLGGPYLSNAQIQTIAAWIDQGAKNN